MQASAAAGDTYPGKQFEHDVAVFMEYWPTRHCVHASAPAVDTYPDEHGVHEVRPASAYVPTWQVEQLVACCAAIFPVSHVLQVTVPICEANFPAAHP